MDRKVVGWFYRNGKRIPIFEKAGSGTGDLRSGKAKRAQDEARSNTIKTIARIDSGLANGSTMMDKAKARDKRDRLEESLQSDFYKKPEPTDRDELRANVRDRDRKSRNEILDYSDNDAKAFDGVFDVASPRETANLMGKRVRTSDGKIVRPVKRSGIDLETRASDAVAESVGKELASKPKRGGKRKPKKDPNALDRNVPNYLKDGVSETAFTDTRGDRQWARNVQSLPEKKRRFSNGYSKLGSTETRDIYVDRDSTNGDYYATPRKPGGTGGVGGRSPRPGIRYSGKTRGEAALKKNVKTAMGLTGRRRDGIHLPQEAALANKKPGESYIKYIMEERGLSRASAIKFIMDKRKGI